jgi:hypothetical protein
MGANDLQVAYLAGFFDGEGCISVARTDSGGTYSLIVTVSQMDGRDLEPFAERWGGKIVEHRRERPRKTYYQWGVGGSRALKCLQDLLPYLRGKREEALVAIKWPRWGRTGRGHTVSEEVVDQRREIRLSLKRIKREKKGRAPDAQPGVDRIAAESLLTRPDVQRAIKLYGSGMSYAEVADELGVGEKTVGYWMRKAGVSRRRGPRPGKTRGWWSE